MAKRLKPVLPSLREKKRYLVFEVLSKHSVDFRSAIGAINNAVLKFQGYLGAAKAGIVALDNKWNQEKQQGIIKVSRKSIDDVRASLIFANKINNHDVIIKSIGVSGILKKAENNYLKMEVV